MTSMSRPQTLPQNLPGLWRISRYFWPHVRQFHGLIASSFLALFAEIGLRLLEPWPLKFVFDRVIGTRAGKAQNLTAALDSLGPATLLTLACVALLVITGLRALASYWNTIGFAQIGNRVLNKVRGQLYRHVQYLSLSFHTRAKTGDLVVRVISDVSMLQDVAVTALIPTIAKVLIVTSIVGLMFYLNWQLALIAIAVFPPFWVRNVRLMQRLP